MRLGDNQKLAASYLGDSCGRGIDPASLAKKMGIGPTRALDILERLAELGIARHHGSRMFAEGPKFGLAGIHD